MVNLSNLDSLVPLVSCSLAELCRRLHGVRGQHLAASVHQLGAAEGGHPRLPALRSQPEPVAAERRCSLPQAAVRGRPVCGGGGSRGPGDIRPLGGCRTAL